MSYIYRLTDLMSDKDLTGGPFTGSSDMSMGDGWIATGVLIKD